MHIRFRRILVGAAALCCMAAIMGCKSGSDSETVISDNTGEPYVRAFFFGNVQEATFMIGKDYVKYVNGSQVEGKLPVEYDGIEGGDGGMKGKFKLPDRKEPLTIQLPQKGISAAVNYGDGKRSLSVECKNASDAVFDIGERSALKNLPRESPFKFTYLYDDINETGVQLLFISGTTAAATDVEVARSGKNEFTLVGTDLKDVSIKWGGKKELQEKKLDTVKGKTVFKLEGGKLSVN